MGYRRMNIIDLKCIYRRLRSDQSIKTISESEGYDRKTIRHYRDAMKSSGLLNPSSPYNNLISFLYRQLTFSIITTDFVFH